MPDADGNPTQEDVDKLDRALKAERKLNSDRAAELAKLRTDLDAALAAAKGKGKGDADGELQAKLEKLEGELQSTRGELNEEKLNRLRLEVGAAKGLTPKQALRLSGSTREELEADADDEEAFPRRAAKGGTGEDEGDGENGENGGTDDGGQQPIRGGAGEQHGGQRQQVRENLRGGGRPNEEPIETDPRKLAESIPRL